MIDYKFYIDNIDNLIKIDTNVEIKKIIENGHEIGTHSSTHPNMSKLSSEKIKEEFFNYDLEIQTPHYYDFGYFFNRKDSGSCMVKLMFELDNLEDIDECVEIALANNALDEEYAGNIVYIEELTEEEAIDFGFEI